MASTTLTRLEMDRVLKGLTSRPDYNFEASYRDQATRAINEEVARKRAMNSPKKKIVAEESLDQLLDSISGNGDMLDEPGVVKTTKRVKSNRTRRKSQKAILAAQRSRRYQRTKDYSDAVINIDNGKSDYFKESERIGVSVNRFCKMVSGEGLSNLIANAPSAKKRRLRDIASNGVEALFKLPELTLTTQYVRRRDGMQRGYAAGVLLNKENADFLDSLKQREGDITSRLPDRTRVNAQDSPYQLKKPLIDAIILRSHGETFSEVKSKTGVSESEFYWNAVHSLPYFARIATAHQKRSLERLIASPSDREQLFEMEHAFLDEQYATLQSGGRLVNGTENNLHNCQYLAFIAVASNLPRVSKLGEITKANRRLLIGDIVGNTKVKGISGNVGKFAKEIHLGSLKYRPLKKGDSDQHDLLKLMDGGYQLVTEDASLFDASQSYHLPAFGKVRARLGTWTNPDTSGEMVDRAFVNYDGRFAGGNDSAVAALEDIAKKGVRSVIEKIGLRGCEQAGFNGKYKRKQASVLLALDHHRQNVRKLPSLFDRTQSKYSNLNDPEGYKKDVARTNEHLYLKLIEKNPNIPELQSSDPSTAAQGVRKLPSQTVVALKDQGFRGVVRGTHVAGKPLTEAVVGGYVAHFETKYNRSVPVQLDDKGRIVR
jgi:hypothetical protein